MLHLRILPKEERMSYEDWVTMVRSPLVHMHVPKSKTAQADNLIFVATFEHRLGASSFAGIAAGAIYAFTQEFSARHPIFLCYGVVALFCSFVNFTHMVGTNNALINADAKLIGLLFSFGFWVPICAFMWIGFWGSRNAAMLP